MQFTFLLLLLIYFLILNIFSDEIKHRLPPQKKKPTKTTNNQQKTKKQNLKKKTKQGKTWWRQRSGKLYLQNFFPLSSEILLAVNMHLLWKYDAILIIKKMTYFDYNVLEDHNKTWDK